jgi:hypothetical protein
MPFPIDLYRFTITLKLNKIPDDFNKNYAMFRLNQEKMKSKGKELTNKGKDTINHLNESI